jgi:hypothetical protein
MRCVRRVVTTLLAAGVSAAVFFVVRYYLDLQEWQFICGLLVFSVVGFALSMSASLLLRGSVSSSLGLGVAGFLLVPLLFWVVVYAFLIGSCASGHSCLS